MGEHDRLFKRVFRVPEHAAGELLAVLPKELAGVVDMSSLALVETDLVSQKLGERFSDALFSARFRGVDGYIWLALEHQSQPDRWIVLRVLEHLALAWMKLHEEEPRRRMLPPVVCVIVHHGEHGWNAPTSLHELVEGVAGLPELERLVPNFHIIVDDLVLQGDEELKRRPLGTFPKLVLWALRDARTIQRLYGRLVVWAEELSLLAREAPEDFATWMRYVLSVSGDEPLETIQSRILEVAPETEDAMASAAEQLIQKGRADGKLEGKLEGKAEGKAEDVLAILEVRRLAVGGEDRARILKCKDVAELDRWLRKAVTVGSVAELFVS